jgi:hypothetical protein
MQEQNFKNHIRIVPIHTATYFLITLLLIGSLVKLYRNWVTGFGGLLTPLLFIMVALALLSVCWYCRSFALRAQDRAIRAEENLRYFAITGKLLDSKLRMGQIIALRFASNNEFVDLAHKAVEENMSPRQIKEAIQHWKGDYNRV